MLVRDSVLKNGLADWDTLLEAARAQTTARRVRRPGRSPSTAPIPTGLQTLPPGTVPPIVLYRDSNSWCPFCERVWFALEEKGLAFETEFIDLSNKPDWYVSLVPTTLVPAAKIKGTLVYESTAILLALEERFEPALLPTDAEERAIATQWIQQAEANGNFLDDLTLLRKAAKASDELPQLQSTVAAKLGELEAALGQYPGDYFLSQFSLVDIMYSPLLDRLAANLPVYWGFHIKNNPQFPRINAWFTALKQRPAYLRVKSDDATNNLLFRRRYGFEPVENPSPLDRTDSEAIAFRAEAAERLSDNREAAIADIWKNSGVQALTNGLDAATVQDAIDSHLKLLASYLINEETTRLPWGRVGGKDEFNPAVAAVGAITLTYLRNRICAPRDMSASAATAFRSAVDRLLSSLY